MDDDTNMSNISRWEIMRANIQSWRWWLEHWLLTHAFALQFCHCCSGYFRGGMVEPDKCEACYARDYGMAAR